MSVNQGFELTDAQLDQIASMTKGLAGINLHAGKKELVHARLAKRVRKLGLRSYKDYLRYVREDETGEELTNMLDALSTNVTSFFRENDHLHYLKDSVLPRLMSKASRQEARLRIWSAGCSSGEEPYSIAIVLREEIDDLDGWDARILATDLSTKVLARAREGVYKKSSLASVPAKVRSKYFTCVQTRPDHLYRVTDSLRCLVTFARLNLMADWPMRGPFDAMFCRNVMIYFDKPTQELLVGRLWRLLAPGGTLFVGHSESLSGVNHSFKYIRASIYEKA